MKFAHLLIPSILGFLLSTAHASSVQLGNSTIEIPDCPPLVKPSEKDELLTQLRAISIPPTTKELAFFVSPKLADAATRDTPTSEAVTYMFIVVKEQQITTPISPEGFDAVVETAKSTMPKGEALDTSNTISKEMQKRANAFLEQENGKASNTSAPISFGPISESSHHLTILMKNQSTIQINGKVVNQQVIILVNYIYIKEKLLLLFFIRSNDKIGKDDLESLLGIHNAYLKSIFKENGLTELPLKN